MPEDDVKQNPVADAAAAMEEAPAEEPAKDSWLTKCPTCGTWYNKNDGACSNCNTRTPIVVRG